MNDFDDMSSRAQRRSQRRALRQSASTAGLGALLIPLLAISFVFGHTLAPLALLGVVAAYVLLAFLNPDIRARLTNFARTGTPYAGMALSIPLLAISGVFGGPLMMTAVILLAGLVGFMLAMTSPEPSGGMPTGSVPIEKPAPPQVVPAALPAQAQGERIFPLDVRALCRGLPPLQAGQVMTTVDYLEEAVVQAEKSGNARAAFDARQALTDYLPSTVQAWKAQRPEDQDTLELDRALDGVRAIAGTTDGSAQRRAWETQQRFLNSRGEQGEALPGLKKD